MDQETKALRRGDLLPREQRCLEEYNSSEMMLGSSTGENPEKNGSPIT